MSVLDQALDPTSWLRPVGHEDPGLATWTRLGTLDGAGEPIVDPRGVIQVAPGRPGLAWWIAGDDRWYFPSREATVRQSVQHATPIVETRVRVKGGDVCQRAYAVTVPGESTMREVVVIEVENTTGVPCGVAFALRPFGVRAATPVHRVHLDGGVLFADGRPALVLPRSPAGAYATDHRIDLSVPTANGSATRGGFPPLSCDHGLAQAVVVVPLAHRQIFRAVAPVPDSAGCDHGEAAQWPAAVPTAQQVARGWRTQIRGTARARLPDPRLVAVLEAAPTWLSATTSGARTAVGRSLWDDTVTPRWDHVAAIAGAMDRIGFGDRSGVLLARATDALSTAPEADATPLVQAFATHLARRPDPAFARAVAEACSHIVAPLLTRRPPPLPVALRQRTLDAASAVFTLAGEHRAAPRRAGPHPSPVVDPRRWAMTPTPPRGPTVGITSRSSHAPSISWPVGALNPPGAFWMAISITCRPPESGPRRHAVGSKGIRSAWARRWPRSPGTCSPRHRTTRCVSPRTCPPPGGGHRWTSPTSSPHSARSATRCAGTATDRRCSGSCATSLNSTEEARVDTGDPPRIESAGLDPAWHAVGADGEALLGAVAGAGTSRPQGARIAGLQIGAAPEREGS